MTEESDTRHQSAGAGHELRTVRVYINEAGLSVPQGSSVLDALRIFDEESARAVERGESRLVDSRGLDIHESSIVSGGTILRVLPVRSATKSITGQDR